MDKKDKKYINDLINSTVIRKKTTMNAIKMIDKIKQKKKK